MITTDRSRVLADEAERLAAIVSYARDKERLLAQAAELRRTADMEDAAAMAGASATEHATLIDRMRAWMGGRRR